MPKTRKKVCFDRSAPTIHDLYEIGAHCSGNCLSEFKAVRGNEMRSTPPRRSKRPLIPVDNPKMPKQASRVSRRDAVKRARVLAINLHGRTAVEIGNYFKVVVISRKDKPEHVHTVSCAAVDGTPDTWKFPTRLHCFDLFAGKGRASEYNASRGGESKRIGFPYGHDLKSSPCDNSHQTL